MTPIQKHIACHLRNKTFDPTESLDSQLSLYSEECIVGMIESGEATYDDLLAVGGEVLTDRIAKRLVKA